MFSDPASPASLAAAAGRWDELSLLSPARSPSPARLSGRAVDALAAVEPDAVAEAEAEAVKKAKEEEAKKKAEEKAAAAKQRAAEEEAAAEGLRATACLLELLRVLSKPLCSDWLAPLLLGLTALFFAPLEWACLSFAKTVDVYSHGSVQTLPSFYALEGASWSSGCAAETGYSGNWAHAIVD